MGPLISSDDEDDSGDESDTKGFGLEVVRGTRNMGDLKTGKSFPL